MTLTIEPKILWGIGLLLLPLILKGLMFVLGIIAWLGNEAWGVLLWILIVALWVGGLIWLFCF